MADEKYRLENHTAAELDELLTKLGELYSKEELDELIAAKVDKAEGMGLSQESFTTAEKEKLATLKDYYTRDPSATITSNSDLNNYKTPGRFGCNTGSVAATILNAPYSTSGYRLEVVETTGNNLLQKLYPNNLGLASGAYYMRTYAASNETWTSWYKYQGEAVT